MGLSAGQARLLTITARKSDCEFRSMSLSHQKIALSRELADISNEYQNSLNQTKLVYDYYGSGDTSNHLSYGILMTPSALNEYMPKFITDSANRIVLNDKYAAAAKAAGIPQEGLGTIPSEIMRNTFINALADNELTTQSMSEKIRQLPYNQNAGFGGGNAVFLQTQEMNYTQYVNYLNQNCTETYDVKKETYSKPAGFSKDLEVYFLNYKDNGDIDNGKEDANVSISQLLSSDPKDRIALMFKAGKDDGGAILQRQFNPGSELGVFLDYLEDCFASTIGIDNSSKLAIEYARYTLEDLLFNGFDSNNIEFKDLISGGKHWDKANSAIGHAKHQTKNYMGFVNGSSGSTNTVGLNLNYVAQAFLTLIVQKMEGVSATNENGEPKYEVKKGKIENNKLVSANSDVNFTVKTGSDISSDDMAQATFYDTLFNKICMSGWTTNNNVEDSEYLQQMLQSGMMFVTNLKDDGYYYQSNYATDQYIKEISDETLIAQAEAKYNTEKAKLNAKEETIDLKMKNIDTELSSLNTEYDTVKNTISKNVDRSFKRYNA